MYLRKKRLQLLIGFVVVIAALLPVSVAMAAFTPVGGIGSDDFQAGAHPMLTTTMTQAAKTPATCGLQVGAPTAGSSFCTEPDVKTITQIFPRGILADPNATSSFCTPSSVATPVTPFIPTALLKSCPADTKVGTVSLLYVICGSAACITAPGTGNVYNAEASLPDADGSTPSRQGHLIALTDPVIPGYPNARQDFSFNIKNGDTIDTSVTGLTGNASPGGAGSVAPFPDGSTFGAGGLVCAEPFGPTTPRLCDVHPKFLGFALGGAGVTAPVSGHPAVTNPTACDEGTFSQTMTSYGAAPETATNTATFTPTGCDALALNPNFDIALSTYKRGSAPGVVGTVTQDASEAAVKEATITFPRGFGVNTKTTLQSCTVAQQGTGQTWPSCAADTRMGNATINAQQLPDSPGPLFGDVYLGESTGDRQFNILAATSGFFPLVVRGDTGVDTTTGILTTQFRDLPVATFTNFVLNLAGGNQGLLTNPKYCAPATVTADFLSHSGKTATATDTVNIRGCRRPSLKLGIKPSREGAHPTMTLDASSTGTVLRRVTQQLPGGVRWKSRTSKAGTSKAGRQVLGRVWLTTIDGTEKVKLKKSKSSKPAKKGDVLLTGKRSDGATFKARIHRTKKGKPKITMSGLPPVSTLLTGVKLRLYGEKSNWLRLPKKCKRMTFRSRTTDAYNKARGSKVRRKCKK